VHRIGRTGRAGAEGQAVSFVCLDEEGFMQEIERFTKQRIPVQVVEGFAPEPGERAEPIAMGRQTIWGGAGKPPSRDVMAAAAKAARQEMMQRIRDNKAADGERGSRGASNGGGRNGNGNGSRNGSGRNGAAQPQGQRAQPNGQRAQPQGQRAQQQPRPPRNTQPIHAQQPGQSQDRDDRDDRDEDRMPRNIDPLRTNMPGRRDMTGVQRVNVGGQPDPTRTSIDSMGAGRRGGNRNRGGGGGNGARAPSRYAR
jgi:ATP-dependent RNA helicase RhlE